MADWWYGFAPTGTVCPPASTTGFRAESLAAAAWLGLLQFG